MLMKQSTRQYVATFIDSIAPCSFGAICGVIGVKVDLSLLFVGLALWALIHEWYLKTLMRIRND